MRGDCRGAARLIVRGRFGNCPPLATSEPLLRRNPEGLTRAGKLSAVQSGINSGDARNPTKTSQPSGNILSRTVEEGREKPRSEIVTPRGVFALLSATAAPTY